ncbi:MAG: CHRD domain-containing protein [Pyrinomonadaceae bacterium]
MKRLVYSIFFTTAFVLAACTAASADIVFKSSLDATQAMPPPTSSAVGTGTVLLNTSETQVTVTLFFTPLTGSQLSAAIHGPALPGSTGPIIFALPFGNFSQTFAVTSQQAANLKAGLWYFEIRSGAYPSGEIRGQIKAATGVSLPFPQTAGALDSTFGTNGTLSTAVGAGTDAAQAVAIQADGKIVAAGFAFNGLDNDFAVVRYNPDGTLDAAFDGDGIVTTTIGTGNDEAYGVAVQPDGKIILAGQSFNAVDTDIAFVRYNTDGTLDATFSGDGRTTIAAGPGSDTVRSVALQGDGKIIAAGNASNGTNNDIVVVRLGADGLPDKSFGGDGLVLTPIGASSDFAYGVAVQTDGKIVVAGYYQSATGIDTAILRYNADGSPDGTFDGDGISTYSFSPETDEALSLVLQNDGKIVIAGCIRNGGANDFLIARFNVNGAVDTSFATNGSSIVAFSSLIDIALGVAIQPDGKIVAVGFGNNGSNNDFSLVRLNADGTADLGFDGDGRLQTAIGTGGDNANAVTVQADGKIVVVGRTVIGATSDFGVVRYGYGLNSQGNDGFIRLNETTAIRFDNAYRSGNSFVSVLNSSAVPPLPVGWSFIGSPRYIGTSALFSGNILVRLTMPASIDQTNFNAVRIFQFESGVWNDKTALAPPRDFAARSVYALISSLAPIAAASPLGPVTGPSAISGRLLAPGGRAAHSALVTATSAGGSRIYSPVNPFGHFRFKNLPIGENIVIRVSSKRHRFLPEIVSLNDDLAEIELTSQ